MEWRFWIALGLVGAALWSLWIRYKKSKRLGELRHWGRVRGRVISADIEESQTTDSYGDRTDYYDPKIVYEYEADGKVRRGSKLSLDGISFASRRKAEAYLADKQPGAEVPVWVNPKDPDEAVLTVEGSAGWGVPIFFFLLAVAIGIGLFDAAVDQVP